MEDHEDEFDEAPWFNVKARAAKVYVKPDGEETFMNPARDITERLQLVIINGRDHGMRVDVLEDAKREIESLRKALEDFLARSQAVNQWLTNWDVPFADDDEWAGDKKLLDDARNKAGRILAAVGSGSKT